MNVLQYFREVCANEEECKTLWKCVQPTLETSEFIHRRHHLRNIFEACESFETFFQSVNQNTDLGQELREDLWNYVLPSAASEYLHTHILAFEKSINTFMYSCQQNSFNIQSTLEVLDECKIFIKCGAEDFDHFDRRHGNWRWSAFIKLLQVCYLGDRVLLPSNFTPQHEKREYAKVKERAREVVQLMFEHPKYSRHLKHVVHQTQPNWNRDAAIIHTATGLFVQPQLIYKYTEYCNDLIRTGAVKSFSWMFEHEIQRLIVEQSPHNIRSALYLWSNRCNSSNFNPVKDTFKTIIEYAIGSYTDF